MFDSVLIALRQRPADDSCFCHTRKDRGTLPSLCDIAHHTGISALRQAQVSLVLCDSFITRELVAVASLLSRASPESS